MAKKNRAALTNTEISAFCGQMSLMLSSGISSLEGVSVMLEDTADEAEKALLEGIYQSILETGSLTEAMEGSGVFPSYAVSMTRIGEETGRLDDVMASLSAYYAREEDIARSIRSAVLYPLIMIAMMIAVIVVLLVKVMPIFNRVFIQLGSEMTGFSAGLMSVGTALSRYSAAFTALLAVIALLFLWTCFTPSGRSFRHRAGYRFGFSRRILEETAACRFAGGMAITLSGGLTAEQGLELTASLNEDPVFGKKADEVRDLVEGGTKLAEALHKTGIFTGAFSRMALVGEKTGSLDRAMEDIAAQYREDLDSRIGETISVLEPTLVIVLSLIVGVILLSVMLPLLGIMSGI